MNYFTFLCYSVVLIVGQIDVKERCAWFTIVCPNQYVPFKGIYCSFRNEITIRKIMILFTILENRQIQECMHDSWMVKEAHFIKSVRWSYQKNSVGLDNIPRSEKIRWIQYIVVRLSAFNLLLYWDYSNTGKLQITELVVVKSSKSLFWLASNYPCPSTKRVYFSEKFSRFGAWTAAARTVEFREFNRASAFPASVLKRSLRR